MAEDWAVVGRAGMAWGRKPLRAQLLTAGCLLFCLAVVCRGFVLQSAPLDALASVDPRLGGVDGLGVLDAGGKAREQQLSNVDYMHDHRDRLNTAEARVPRHTRRGSVWSGLDDSDGHLPYVNVNAWGATGNKDGVRWPAASRRTHQLRHVINADGVLSRLPSHRDPDVLGRAGPSSDVDGVLSRLEDNLDETRDTENRLSADAGSKGPLARVAGSENPDGVLARTPEVEQAQAVPQNPDGVLSRVPARSGIVVPSDAQVMWDSEGVLNHMREDEAATNGVLGGKNYESDAVNMGGSLFVHGLGSDNTWKAAVHDDGWNTASSTANSGGSLSQMKDSPAGGSLSHVAGSDNRGSLAAVQGSDAGGSLAAVEGSNAGGSLLSLRDSGKAGGVLARTRKVKGSGIKVGSNQEDVRGSLSVASVKDQRELVDGSIAVADGKYGNQGTLSRASGKHELADGVLAGGSKHDMAKGALFNSGGDDMAEGALTRVSSDDMANGDLMAVKDKNQRGGWLARFESQDASSIQASKSKKSKMKQSKMKMAEKAASKATVKTQIKTAAKASHTDVKTIQAGSSSITEMQKKHAENRKSHSGKHRIHQLAEGGESEDKDENEDEDEDEDGGKHENREDIGWVKHLWGLGTWVLFIFFAPVFTAVTAGTVWHYAGSVAAICALIIMFTMDIACYYYSWFLF